MEAEEELLCPSPSPFIASSSSIFRDISNFKTPKQVSRKPSFFQTPGTQFFTASKQTPRASFSSSSSVRRRTSLAPSSSRARTARKLKALEAEQSQSSRKALVQKERSLKSLAKSMTVWLNFLFENPGSCGCNLSTGGGNGDGEVSAKGKRDSFPGIGVRVDAAWRNPKRQRGSAWQADDGKNVASFPSPAYSSLQNSLKDVCSFEDLKRRMRVYLSLGGCNEVFKVMTQVAKNIDEGRLKMKAHCPLVTDVGLKQKATGILMSYNPVWLRIGLYIVFGGDSLLSNGDADSNQEITFLRMIIEKQLFSHGGLAKAYAYNKMVEGLYRPGYYESLGNIILKRLFLLVLVLDRAKSQSSLSLKYGVDGVDGGSPLLFTVQSRIKSSRQVIQDVMLGEGNVLAHLMIVGYKVLHQQSPLVEYDFQISDLFVDLKDGVRLGRATHLLLDDSSILTKLVIPSDTSKKHLANCSVVMQYLRHAGVSLCDDDKMMILGDDIANGDKELTLSLLWNMFVHLQLPHLMKQTLLVEEIYKIRGDTMDNFSSSSSTPLELLLKWIQAICQNYNCRIDNFSTLVDGKAIWCLLDYYFRKELPCSCSSKVSCRSTGEESIVLVTEYPDAVHNFLLSQRLTTLLGNFPEVLQISDILEYNGACNDRSVVILLVFLASQLIVKKNMDQINFHKLLGCPYQSPVRKLSSIGSCSSTSEVVGTKDETCDHTTEDAARKFKAVQAWWREMTERNYQSVTQLTAPVLHDISSKQNIINIQKETAAKAIQSCFRRRIKHHNYVKKIKAASLLQTVIRAWLIARKKPSSPIFWDTHLQGFSCERWQKSEMWWRYGIFILERHSFVKLKKSVLLIQRAARSWITQRHQLSSVGTSVALSLNLSRASFVIQKYFRGGLARSSNFQVLPAENANKGVDDLVNASIMIQKHIRGWLARSWYINEVVQIEKAISVCPNKGVPDQINASIVIQKYFRGWLVRSRYIFEVARVDKTFNSDWKRSVDDLTIAAVKIQLAWKSYIVHSHLQSQQFAATKIQSHIRCWLLRRKFQNQKQSILKIQRNFRMSRCLKTYQIYKTLVQSATVIQSFIRQCACLREACKRKHMIIIIQRYFRGWSARREFLSRREATTIIQSAIRGQIFRNVVEYQRHAATEIQSFARGVVAQKKLLGTVCLHCGTPGDHILHHSKGCKPSCEIKLEVSSALRVQRWWRRVMSIKLKTESAVVIQSQVRGWIARRKVIREFCSVVKLQRWWKGVFSLKLRTRSALEIQSHVRRWIARRRVTGQFCSVIKLQRWWKGVMSLKLKTESAVVIQSHVRGWITRKKVNRELCSVVKLQRWWKGVVSLKLRTQSAVVIQSHVRCWIIRRKVTREFCSVVKLQRWCKGVVSLKLKTRSAVVIQSYVRGWIARRKVTRELYYVLKLQRWWRGYVSLKLRAISVVVIQSHIRGWIARRNATRQRHHIVVIQSNWKGYLARKDSRGQLLDLRLRMENTAANVDDGMRIINRLIAAVSELLGKKSISGILHTCATLDMATQYSQKCCEELVKARAINTLLELIRSVSRSIPDQEVLKHALSTLRNLARYPHLVEVLIECRGSTEIILLQLLRSKEDIYFIASDLMRKICSSSKGVEAVRKSPALLKRLHNLVEELTRKAYNEKRNVRGPFGREPTERRLREAVHLLKLVTEG